jgi:hypothetical protein
MIAVLLVVAVMLLLVVRARSRSRRRGDATDALTTVLLDRAPYQGRRWKESERPWL